MTEIKTRELKTLPEYFEAVVTGRKKFEVRKNDRNFQVDEILFLREWDALRGYSGRNQYAKVDYILNDKCGFGLKKGYVVMSITLVYVVR